MSKSKTSIKRRKTTKQKTFQFKRNGQVFKIKALTSQSALSKLINKRVNVHEKDVNTFDYNIKKIRASLSVLNESLSSYINGLSKFSIFINYILRLFRVKTKEEIQKTEIRKESNILASQRKVKRDFEINRPYVTEFKICF